MPTQAQQLILHWLGTASCSSNHLATSKAEEAHPVIGWYVARETGRWMKADALWMAESRARIKRQKEKQLVPRLKGARLSANT